MKETFYNLVSSLLNKFVATGLAIYFVPIYIQYLGIEPYGIVGLYTTIVSAIFLFDFGLTNIISKEMAQRTTDQNNHVNTSNFLFTLEILYVLIGILIGGFIWVGSPWIVSFWVTKHTINNLELIYCMKLIAIAIAAQWPHSFYSGALFGVKKQVVFNITYVLFSIIKVIGAFLILKYYNSSIGTFLWWNIITAILLSITLRVILWKSKMLSSGFSQFKISELHKIKKLTFGLTSIGVLIFIVSDFDKLLLIKYLSLTDFGYYTLAFIIPSGLLILGTSIKNTLFPNISKDLIAINTSLIKENYHFYSQILIYIVLPLSLVLFFFSAEIIFLWTKNEFITLKITHLVTFLTLGSLLNCFTMIEYAYIIIKEKTKFLFQLNLICGIISLPILYFLLQEIGLLAAGIYWFLFNLIQFLILKYYFHTKILKDEFIKYLLVDLGTPLIFSIVVLIPFKWGYNFIETNNSILFLFFLVVFMTIYFVLLIVKSEFRKNIISTAHTFLEYFKLKK